MSILKIAVFKTPKASIKRDYRKIKFTKEEQNYLNEYKAKANYSKKKPISFAIKRGIDTISGVVGLVLSAPIIALAAMAIKINSKGTVIFKQKRIGLDGKPFDTYKLRTMYQNSDSTTNVKDKNDNRITKVGKFLRKFSIDEFPQFYNILKGDMSLIGPRPVTPAEHFNINMPENAIKYAVKPGAKLEYSKDTLQNPKNRIKIEKDYIENWSLKRDGKAFMQILKDVFGGNNY